MDKQEMVRCLSNMCGGEICLHREPHLAIDVCEMNVRGCGVCQPVEPAQPELPEIKYSMEIHSKLCKTNISLGLLKEIEELVYRAGYKKGVADSYKCGQLDLEQALKRIAGLEQEKADYGLSTFETGWAQAEGETKAKYEAEIASLKEQLAVVTKGIPKGMSCETGAEEGDCPYLVGESCVITGKELLLDSHYSVYLKCAGCPVPAKEEAE